MTRRFDERRCGAFLEVLGVTGNVTLAAERCNVSRSWVALRRKEDAAFDDACRGMCRVARENLLRGEEKERLEHSPHPSAAKGRLPPSPASGRGANAPPSDWAYLDGVELVVRGSNGRRCQIGRARAGQWSARTEERFLAALCATCNVKAACAEVGKHVTSAYAHRKRWTAFARRWAAAIETGYVRIEMALLENACNLFSTDELPPEEALRGMTVDHAIHVLHMHKNEVRGIGKRPGLVARVRPLADYQDSILKKIEIIKRARSIGGGAA